MIRQNSVTVTYNKFQTIPSVGVAALNVDREKLTNPTTTKDNSHLYKNERIYKGIGL